MTKREVVVFGARGGTGLELVRAALAADWSVCAVIRPDADPSPLAGSDCTIARADALDGAAVERAIAATRPGRVVVSTLGSRVGGPSVDHLGNATVIDAAVRQGCDRMVLVSSLGCGDSRTFASERLLAAIGGVLEAKTRAEDHLRASGLPFVLVRPGGLIDAPASGQGALYEDPRVHGRIARPDLAAVVLDCLDDGGALGRTLSAIDRTLLSPSADTVEYIPVGAER